MHTTQYTNPNVEFVRSTANLLNLSGSILKVSIIYSEVFPTQQNILLVFVLDFYFLISISLTNCSGWLAKDNCSKLFYELGCDLCMKTFDSPILLSEHKWTCHLPPPIRLVSSSLITKFYLTASKGEPYFFGVCVCMYVMK